MSKILTVGTVFSCEDGRAQFDAPEEPSQPMFALIKWSLPISTAVGGVYELTGEVIEMSDERDYLREQAANATLKADTRYAYSVARTQHLTAE